MRAVVYTRQSLDLDGTHDAVRRQLEDCERLCSERGWEIVRRYQDNDRSASGKKPRPEYLAMLEALDQGGADAVVCWHIDRLTRSLKELEEIIELAERTGVKVVTLNGDIDLSNDSGRLVGRILASVARGEIERKGKRQSRAHQQKAERGLPAGGRRPFGYGNPNPDDRGKITWVVTEVNEPEAELIRAAYQAVLEGGSLRGIATAWNATGVTTTMGRPWTHSTVRRMLQNPRNTGLRTYKGEIVGDAAWPAIIDRDTFDAVHALLAMPERSTTTGRTRLYLLPGLALCHCGSPVTTGKSSRGKRTYRCRDRKGHMCRAAEPIDALVGGGEIDGKWRRGLVVERLDRADAVDLLSPQTGPDLARLREKDRAIRERMDNLAEALEQGVLTLPAVRRSSDRLKKELADIEGEIAALSATDVLAPLVNAPDVEKMWQSYDLARRRAVVDVLMTVTLLAPGLGRRPFDPHTVKVEWRQ